MFKTTEKKKANGPILNLDVLVEKDTWWVVWEYIFSGKLRSPEDILNSRGVMDNNDIIDIEICKEEDCVEEHNLPTAMEMAKNLMRDGSSIIGNAIRGNPTLVSDEVRDHRWNTCTGCPFLQNNRCSKCGCFMKVKVAFQTSKCPENKW
jgi:hypothetical protein